MFNRKLWVNPYFLPITVITALSVLGTLFYFVGSRKLLIDLLSDRASPFYFLISPFIHGGIGHLLFNVMALYFIGGLMLLPRLGRKNLSILFVIAVMGGTLANNILSATPAIGISAGVMGIVSCALYPYARAPMKFLILHDLLRLPPFQYRYVVLVLPALDMMGLILGWHFFAHWAHLSGFGIGLIYGYLFFVKKAW